MMRHRSPCRIRLVGLALLAASLAVGACSDDTRDAIEDDSRTAATEIGEALDETGRDAAEFAARNMATEQGEEQFNNAGHPINDDKLTCTATFMDDADRIAIECSGTTEAGGAAMLVGTTDEVPTESIIALEGEFVGTVDGTEVFTTTELGG